MTATPLHSKGSGNNWIVEVQIRYGLADGEPVWVSRCKHESDWNEKDSWSIEAATKCALKDGLAPRTQSASRSV